MSKRNKIGEIKAGDVFEVNGGSITVLHYKNKDCIYVKHNDKNEHCMWTRKDAIEKGMVKNPYYPSVEGIGYIGVGGFKPSYKGKATEEYAAWRSMLTRCYKEGFLDKNKTYKGCSVCDEWLNFQNFAYWYTREDEYGRGHALDKDILLKGNKIYSPETCCLIPQGLNSFFSSLANDDKESRSVHKNATGKFVAKISKYGKQKHLGVFDTEQEARLVYSREKAIRAKELALEHRGDIRYKVFLAIMNWEF